MPYNIVRLPFAGPPAGINQRDKLTVNTAGHAVNGVRIFIRIEHLSFMALLIGRGSQKYAPVAPLLPFAGNIRRYAPLDVQLVIDKMPFGLYIIYFFVYCKYAVMN